MEDNNYFGDILSDNDIMNLFNDESVNEPQQTKDNTVDNADTKNNEVIDVNPDELFGGLQESVDDGNTNSGEDATNKQKSSPNFHSSILDALRNDGILPELSDDDIKNVKDDEGFKDVFEKIIDSRLDERTRRIEQALNSGADIQAIKQYEGIISQLQSIDENTISQEGRNGEELRRKVIAQDYMNRGFSRERIAKLLKQTFEAGTDIEDAKEALTSNLQFYQQKYNDLIQQGLENERLSREMTKQLGEKLRKSIVEDNGIFEDIGIDKRMRQKIYDTLSKPTYKDESGNWFTELQKYQMDNPTDFLKYVSMFYTMTDGFKNIDKVVNKQVQKLKKSYVKDLENKLSGVNRTSAGSLNFIGQGDSEFDFLEGLNLANI